MCLRRVVTEEELSGRTRREGPVSVGKGTEALENKEGPGHCDALMRLEKGSGGSEQR